MMPLLANLKHFYQRFALWVLYAWLVTFRLSFIALLLDPPRGSEDWMLPGFGGYLMASVAMGVAVAGLQHEIMLKPFSFMLPGHRRMPRRVLLVVGLVVNLLLGMAFLRYPGLTRPEAWAAVGAAAALGLAAYTAGAMLVFGTRTVRPVVWILLALFIGGNASDLNAAVVIAVVQQPLWVIVGSLAVLALAWPYLAGTALARRLCNARGLGMLESLDPDKAREYQRRVVAERMQAAAKDGPSWREQWFAAGLGRCQPYGAGRAALGAIYERVGAYPARRLAAQILIPLALLLLLGYGMAPIRQSSLGVRGLPPHCQGSLGDALFLFVGLASLHYALPTGFRVPLPLGRRERLVAALAGLAALGLVICLILALTAACGAVIAPYMPPITLKTSKLLYRGLDLRFLAVTILVLPLGALCRAFVRDQMMRLLPIMVLVPFSLYWVSAFVALPWVWQAGALVSVWGLTVALLWYHCARRDLSTW